MYEFSFEISTGRRYEAEPHEILIYRECIQLLFESLIFFTVAFDLIWKLAYSA